MSSLCTTARPGALDQSRIRSHHTVDDTDVEMEEAHEVDVDLVATSEVSITMTADRADHLPAFCEELGELGDVTVEPDHALICVVGQGIAHTPGIAAQVLGTLAEAGVHVRVISQGAIKVNIGLVIQQADLNVAVNRLHSQFF